MPQPDRHFDWRPLAPQGTAPTVVADPRLRLRMIYSAFVVLLALVLIRAAVLEATVGETFRHSTDRSRTVTEPIAALRGRLLSRDGTVLACDEAIASLAVDYRYLEDPPNEVWLRSLARKRLGSVAARDPQRRTAEMARLRVEIAEMSRRLAALCDMPQSQWTARCRGIQRQIETIAANVNANRQEQFVRRVATEEPAEPEPATPAAIVRRAVLELFVPPFELPPPRIAVREQQQAHVVARGLSLDVVAEIEKHAKEFPGVEIRREVRRSYPRGSLAAQMVGYVSASGNVDPKAVAPTTIGRSGAEQAAEPWLRGVPGITRRQLDSRGQTIDQHVERPSHSGRDFVLTVDAGIQNRAEQLLDEFQSRARVPGASLGPAVVGEAPPQTRLGARTAKPRPPSAGGAVLVIDVHSGAVLAAATAPRFDPNVLVGGSSTEINKLLHGVGHPLLDRTAQMALSPGSVFKALTAIALLESEGFDPQAKFECRGYLHRPDAQRCMIFRHFGVGHGPITLREALAQSCNVYFQRHALSLGPAPLVDWAARFGFGNRTNCDWCQDSPGKLPSPLASQNNDESKWKQADTEAIAIGQGRLTTTPLQVARLMAAVANGGRLVTPHLLADVGLGSEPETSAEPDVLPLPEHPTRPVPGLSREKLAALRAGLEAVVADLDGTGYNTVRVASVAIAGKTGTAETGGNLPDHAWFAGYAPAEAPRIAVVVALEHGGSGAESAGPIARQVVEHLAERGYFTGTRSR
ncbi:MAG: hypothetical protein K8T91_24305 [Planctomycetes bacterium]|nr:hypothetical protein [Planctomycetota bacterium]